MKKYIRKRDRRAENQTALLVVLLVVGLLALVPTFASQFIQLDIFQIAVGLGLLLLVLGGLFLWYVYIQQQKRLHALALSDIDNMTGIEFEQYVGKVLQSQGYSVQFTKISGDFGSDIVAYKDHLKYVIQLKRYNYTVSLEAVQQAVASMKYYECDLSMVVTNNYYTKPAKILALANKCKLIDRDTLAEWIVAFQKGK